MKKYLPQLQIIIGSLMISFSAVFVKLTTSGPTVDGFYRMFFGGIMLFIIAVLRRQSFKYSRTALLFTVFAGLFFALDLTFWHAGVGYIGPGLATIIINLQVFILAIIGLLIFKEIVNWKFYIAIPTAIVGMYFLIADDWSTAGAGYQIGVYLCFIGMINYTFYLLALRKSQSISIRPPTIANLAVISLISAVILAVIGLLQHESFALNLTNATWLVLYGLFGQVLGWLLIAHGLPYVRLSVAGFLLLTQPACSFLWDILIFHRVTDTAEIIGAIITLFAIYLSSTSRRKNYAQQNR